MELLRSDPTPLMMGQRSWWGAMTRVTRDYSYGQIDRAGKILARNDLADSEMSEALKVMNNWRAAHAYPLETAARWLRKASTDLDPKAIVAERLKRLESITSKLTRERGMQLSRMQDIGGCRAIFQDMAGVKTLLGNSSAVEFGLLTNIKKTDYIANPKPSGYRSVHFIWKYKAETQSSQCYDGMSIEIQIRSALQHAWATAVEMAATYTGEDFKSSRGGERWLRFFQLMGSAIAIKEDCPIVPDTPQNKRELIRELRAISDELKVPTLMKTWAEMTNAVTPHFDKGNIDTSDARHSSLFLIVLRKSERNWFYEIQPFPGRSNHSASEAYSLAEQENAGRAGVQVALVSVHSIDLLRKAYPNYHGDTSQFLKVLDEVVYGAGEPAIFGVR